MSSPTGAERHIENLRLWRNWKPRDVTLRGAVELVDKKYARPHKQLGQIVGQWEQLIPPTLRRQTALASLTKGVLTVHVSDSAAMYELDRLMRSGVEQQIKSACKTTLRKIRLQVVPMEV